MNLRLPHLTNKHYTLWLLLLRVNGRLIYACAGANRILCTTLVPCCWLVSICRENYSAIAQTTKLMSAPLILVGGLELRDTTTSPRYLHALHRAFSRERGKIKPCKLNYQGTPLSAYKD